MPSTSIYNSLYEHQITGKIAGFLGSMRQSKLCSSEYAQSIIKKIGYMTFEEKHSIYKQLEDSLQKTINPEMLMKTSQLKRIEPVLYLTPSTSSNSVSNTSQIIRGESYKKVSPEDYFNKTIAGRYVISDKYKKGGIAIVFDAYDNITKQNIAIKIYQSHDAQSFARCRREVEIMAMLCNSGSNTPRLYDLVDEGIIAMEYLRGITLSEFIRREIAYFKETNNYILTPLQKCKILMTLLEQLEKAHEEGIVHRDVKLDNIMVCGQIPSFNPNTIYLSQNLDIELRLFDFGLGTNLKNKHQVELTQMGCCLGSPLYMSPEQMNGEATDHRTDIFSLGKVLYEFLALTPLYVAKNMQELRQYMNAKIAISVPQNKQIPKIIRELVIKATEKKIHQRYSSVSEMKEKLKLFIYEEGMRKYTIPMRKNRRSRCFWK